MPKKKQNRKPIAKPRKSVRAKAKKVIHQVKEPLSLLGTLKEEGLSSAVQFLAMAGAMAGEARKNFKLEAVAPQLKDLVSSLGFVTRSDLERIEERLDELEQKISEKEFDALRRGEEE